MEDIINQVQLDEALDKWEADYQPVTNHLVPDSSWSGWMFETYGDELNFVLSQPNEHVWTWLNSDEGTFLSAGYHWVNRLGYLITEKPWTDPCPDLQVDIYAEFCGECGNETDNCVCHPDCPTDGRMPEYTCHWCDTPTWNGAGHWQEEMGYDHPQGEDRICTPCFRKWEGEQTNA